MKHSNWIRSTFAGAALALAPALFAQGNSVEGRLRAMNAQLLQLRGQLFSAAASQQGVLHSQAAPIFAQRKALLELLIESQPGLALQLGFPADVIDDLGAAFPEAASTLEARGTYQGDLLYLVGDSVGFTSHREMRRLRVNGRMVDMFTSEPFPAGARCNEVVEATGVLSGDKLAAETTTLVGSGTNPCSPSGAQKIAVILVNFPSQGIAGNVTPDFVKGVFLGNSFSSDQQNPNRSISDFWTQNSDGKTWVNSSGTGSLTVVSVSLGQNYSYCAPDGSGNLTDNSAAVRQAAYAAANGSINYNDFARVVVILPNNGSCSGWAGFGTIGCWSNECPGDGACNFSWSWWRDDQVWNRSAGVNLGTHEMGHNLGMNHSGSRYHPGVVVGPVNVAGTRSEYGDNFGTMGFWNFGFYNASHELNTLGWLNSSSVRTVTTNGTYAVQSFDSSGGSPKALKIQRGTGNTGAWLYVAYYPAGGVYLGALGGNVHGGAIIHYQDAATPGGKTDLLDFTQATPNDFGDPALVSGATWVDPYTDLTLTIGSVVNGVLNVTATYSSPPCTTAAPTVAFGNPTSQSVPAGSSIGYQVMVTSNDSIACPARTFTPGTGANAGITTSFSPSILSVGPGATGNTTLTESTTSNTSLGTYVVTATATSGRDSGTAPQSASLAVTAAPPGAPSNLTASSSYSGTGKNKQFVRVSLAWADNSANETGFDIERCKVSGKGGSATCTFSALASVAGGVKTYQDPAPIPSGTYKYRVRSKNATGPSPWSNSAQATI